MENQEKWVEELKKDERLKIIIGGYCYAQDGGNGGYDYNDILDYINGLIEKERKKWVEEICKYILAKHEHFIIKNKEEIETDRPILDSLELEEFIKNLK